jgi:hypothetical protein
MLARADRDLLVPRRAWGWIYVSVSENPRDYRSLTPDRAGRFFFRVPVPNTPRDPCSVNPGRAGLAGLSLVCSLVLIVIC